MIVKLLSLVLLISVSYTLAIFVVPQKMDLVSENLGISGYNRTVRSMKAFLDNLPHLASFGSGKVQDFQEAVKGAQETLQTTKALINDSVQQIEQTRKEGEEVIENFKKVQQATTELQNSISNLVTFSGATQSGQVTASGNISASGDTQ